MGECGARLAIWSGSMLEAYAAYSATLPKATPPVPATREEAHNEGTEPRT
ncbi:hypothetical protein GCM10022254_48600 [Actinomadura meridiana]|uniref:Uncharacterized protein n=1 Tax=Actinomadura meridiana TaxID=559626 RepID=A0ABP8CBN1_9ACTN